MAVLRERFWGKEERMISAMESGDWHILASLTSSTIHPFLNHPPASSPDFLVDVQAA